MLELNWIRCKENKWCSLNGLNLDSLNDTLGVYIIWHVGDNPRVVRVGQGNIKARIAAHREDEAVLAYQDHGLYVTWASAPEQHLDGIEAHLAQHWGPLVGDRFPDTDPIEVNSPLQ